MRHRTAAYRAAARAIAFAAARTRIKDLIPQGASVFTGTSETLRLSGIDAGINTGGRYQAFRHASGPWTGSPRPRPGGLRAAQRHQPPAHPQRRTHPGRGTVLLLREPIGF